MPPRASCVSASYPAPAPPRFLGAGLHLNQLSRFRGPPHTTARTRATERMRRSRKRRRDGLRSYTIQLRDQEAEVLVRLGLLSPTERSNRNSVIKALHSFFDETLGQIR